jgi:putative membrane protein
MGMVNHDAKVVERFGTHTCVLFRFVVSCCAADAMPAAILLMGDALAGCPNDTWIRAEGRFAFHSDRDQPVPVLKLYSAAPTKKPRRPYRRLSG